MWRNYHKGKGNNAFLIIIKLVFHRVTLVCRGFTSLVAAKIGWLWWTSRDPTDSWQEFDLSAGCGVWVREFAKGTGILCDPKWEGQVAHCHYMMTPVSACCTSFCQATSQFHFFKDSHFSLLSKTKTCVKWDVKFKWCCYTGFCSFLNHKKKDVKNFSKTHAQRLTGIL